MPNKNRIIAVNVQTYAVVNYSVRILRLNGTIRTYMAPAWSSRIERLQNAVDACKFDNHYVDLRNQVTITFTRKGE